MKKMTSSFSKLKGLAVMLTLVVPALTWAQATNSVMINVTKDMIKAQVDGSKAIDLIAEIRKQRPALSSQAIELQMLRVQAKSNIGGAQLLLKINNDFVASAVVETDPDQFSVDDDRSYGTFELKNIDRSKINSASLQLQIESNIKVKSIEIVLGAVQEPAIFGRYAQDQATVIGGVDDSEERDMRPTDAAVAAIYGTYYGNDEDVILAQQQAQAEAAAKAEQERIQQETLQRQQQYYAELARQEEEARLARLEQARLEALRPKPNYSNPVQCVKAKKKKTNGKKEVCIGEVIYGVWAAHSPMVIDVNAKDKTIYLLFTTSNQPLVMKVDDLPNGR